MRHILHRTTAAILILIHISLYGCATPGHIPEAHRQQDRSVDYPVGITYTSYVPEVDVDFRVRGKGQGAGAGALEGMLSCADAASGGGDFAALVLLLCLPVGAAVGAVAGTVTTESATTAAAAEAGLQQQAVTLTSQASLAESVRARLAGSDAAPGVVIVDNAPTPAPPADGTAATASAVDSYSTLLEVVLLDIVFRSSGKKAAPLCLQMRASATKREAASGQQLDAMESSYQGDCALYEDWIRDGGRKVMREIATGYEILAENIADELYLVYVPATAKGDLGTGQPRKVPDFVLAPEYPPLEDLKLAFKPFKQHRADYGGFGGLQFTTIDNLTPVFAWEAFPRPFDEFTPQGAAPEDISYELRLYEGALTGLDAVAPARVLHTVRGIRENRLAWPHSLRPCNWYFWTVRARFSLHGVPRVTEWAGVYSSLGGDLYPSADRRSSGGLLHPWPGTYLYYPFSTPADAAYGGACGD